jgi:hypothetical protein
MAHGLSYVVWLMWTLIYCLVIWPFALSDRWEAIRNNLSPSSVASPMSILLINYDRAVGMTATRAVISDFCVWYHVSLVEGTYVERRSVYV